MNALLLEVPTSLSPESLVQRLRGEPGIVLLRSALFDLPEARHSFVTARPFLTFRSSGSRCDITHPASRTTTTHFGNPWHVLDSLMSRYEVLDEMDLPFPTGGCFGFWGYDLKNFVEPRLPRRATNDLELPDCCVGFFDSLVVFDHRLDKTWIVSTGLNTDGSRNETRAKEQAAFWREVLEGNGNNRHPTSNIEHPTSNIQHPTTNIQQPTTGIQRLAGGSEPNPWMLDVGCSMFDVGSLSSDPHSPIRSTLSRSGFLSRVARAQEYIRTGHIYQVNLSHRLTAPTSASGWELFEHLSAVSPAPFSAFLDCGEFQIASSSPEQFLRLSGSQIRTRPIKGTRPRSSDPDRDAQLTYELQTSPKEMAELVMITDLLRNDLGKVCEFGSVQVPELVRLERYPQVQHLVSTVEGRLRKDVTHFSAFASCFPGGSITGAPKIRAMEIIDELEPTARGPYTGALGYLGFNRESQLSITIRMAICQSGLAHFNVGAGIVADSNPDAEYEETMAKARGFLAAIARCNHLDRKTTNPKNSAC